MPSGDEERKTLEANENDEELPALVRLASEGSLLRAGRTPRKHKGSMTPLAQAQAKTPADRSKLPRESTVSKASQGTPMHRARGRQGVSKFKERHACFPYASAVFLWLAAVVVCIIAAMLARERFTGDSAETGQLMLAIIAACATYLQANLTFKLWFAVHWSVFSSRCNSCVLLLLPALLACLAGLAAYHTPELGPLVATPLPWQAPPAPAQYRTYSVLSYTLLYATVFLLLPLVYVYASLRKQPPSVLPLAAAKAAASRGSTPTAAAAANLDNSNSLPPPRAARRSGASATSRSSAASSKLPAAAPTVVQVGAVGQREGTAVNVASMPSPAPAAAADPPRGRSPPRSASAASGGVAMAGRSRAKPNLTLSLGQSAAHSSVPKPSRGAKRSRSRASDGGSGGEGEDAEEGAMRLGASATAPPRSGRRTPGTSRRGTPKGSELVFLGRGASTPTAELAQHGSMRSLKFARSGTGAAEEELERMRMHGATTPKDTSGRSSVRNQQLVMLMAPTSIEPSAHSTIRVDRTSQRSTRTFPNLPGQLICGITVAAGWWFMAAPMVMEARSVISVEWLMGLQLWAIMLLVDSFRRKKAVRSKLYLVCFTFTLGFMVNSSSTFLYVRAGEADSPHLLIALLFSLAHAGLPFLWATTVNRALTAFESWALRLLCMLVMDISHRWLLLQMQPFGLPYLLLLILHPVSSLLVHSGIASRPSSTFKNHVSALVLFFRNKLLIAQAGMFTSCLSVFVSVLTFLLLGDHAQGPAADTSSPSLHIVGQLVAGVLGIAVFKPITMFILHQLSKYRYGKRLYLGLSMNAMSATWGAWFPLLLPGVLFVVLGQVFAITMSGIMLQ